MAPLNSTRKRPSSSRVTSTTTITHDQNSDHEPVATPVTTVKKRRYVPGGPGGGGRYIYEDHVEKAVAGNAPSRSNNNSSARKRPRRDSITVTARTPSLPLRARPRRERMPARPRYSSAAAAAAAAVAHGDGYKPREERSWEEFHHDLDIDAPLAVFTAEEVDGLPDTPQDSGTHDEGRLPNGHRPIENGFVTPQKRKPGRPFRRPDALLDGIGAPDIPKLVPPPGPNPRERLSLPRPICFQKDPFQIFEQNGFSQQNYVDRTMASAGYQESDIFQRQGLIRLHEGVSEEDLEVNPDAAVDSDANAVHPLGRVEYDMDEQDEKWLEAYNAHRRTEQVEAIKPAVFEITMTKIEKEWHALEKRIPKPNPKPPQTQRPRSSSAAAVNGEPAGGGEEQDTKCAICDDGDCENANAIVFCDGCDLAVHQECYGVPYIPEGQWLCRKCHLIGRATPSCIFCPNTEGAFKQTSTSKWAHLLCAIWIPEVSLGNPSLMEPVADVEKVPKNRWKLQCYICKQKMGASIQCGNKNCYQAFHVTCARRAKLSLKMKSGHGSAIMDSNLLKAYCDKHVPPDWRREQNTDQAFEDAKEFYERTMQGKKWADSQASALALGPSQLDENNEPLEDNGLPALPRRITLTIGKKKRNSPPKQVWRLPSGAPVIPQVILDAVVTSLQRFNVRQRKQYAEEACKYWTLKREARRGATLLKRLQLQMETFTSMEITRRNYQEMGSVGGPRLRRRIEFADFLTEDVDKLESIFAKIQEREEAKLEEAKRLKAVVDTVYFPIAPLLWPILEKCQTLDGKGVFSHGLLTMRQKLENRFYTSVTSFSTELAMVFSTELGGLSVTDTADLQQQISGRAQDLSAEEKDKRRLAKRIVKAIQPALEDAIKMEGELNGMPFAKELKALDSMLEGSFESRHNSPVPAEAVGESKPEVADDKALLNGLSGEVKMDVDAAEDKVVDPVVSAEEGTPGAGNEAQMGGVVREANEDGTSRSGSITTALATAQPKVQEEPPTPLSQGGIMWYMRPFDPDGVTVHEERWTGREVLRGMSEELSEIDDDDLKDLMDVDDVPQGPAQTIQAAEETSVAVAPEAPSRPAVVRTKSGKVKKRWRGYR